MTLDASGFLSQIAMQKRIFFIANRRNIIIDM